uniref:Guanylate-binding protein N-terminal domain-containing protein n=1 Tax=viral metagenome TaxID=1070528 RepID=A0A6C0EAA2_9ZZZZ
MDLIKALPLIKIKDGKLELLKTEKLDDTIGNKNVKVLTIIGNGRTGKSSLLNCIASYITKTNSSMFDVQDTDEHCTTGLDMYYFEDDNIILVDCQGLKLADSSTDPQILLITYLLSDVIIYNQRSNINNDVFDTLQPLTSFINYLDNVDNMKKPHLLFRLSDVSLKFDPMTHLAKALEFKNDQYQRVREVIGSLFNGIGITTTSSLDKSELVLLQEKRYLDVINTIDFGKSCEFILSTLISIEPKFTLNKWFESANKFANDINNNIKIDYSKLDIYTLLIEKEINEFIKTISKENDMDIFTSALQEDFDEHCKPRIEFVDNTMALFEQKFKLVDAELFKKYYDETKTELMKPINKAIKRYETLAEDAIEDRKNKKTPWESAIANDESIEISGKKVLNEILDYILNVEKRISKYYNPVAKKYTNRLYARLEDIKKIVQKEIENEKLQINQMNELEKLIDENWDELLKSFLKATFTQYTITYLGIEYDNDYARCPFEEDEHEEMEEIYTEYGLRRRLDYDLYETKLAYIKYQMYWLIPHFVDKHINKVLWKDIVDDSIRIYKFRSSDLWDDALNQIRMKSRTHTYKEHKIAEFRKKLFTKFICDPKVDKIAITKLKQSKLYYWNYDNMILFTDDKNIMSKYGGCSEEYLPDTQIFITKDMKKNKYMEKYITKLKMYVLVETIYIDDYDNNDEHYWINIRDTVKRMKLDEFKKYLIRTYKKQIKFTMPKRELALKLLKGKNKELLDLYRQFEIYYAINHNKIKGLSSCKTKKMCL